MGHVGPDYEAAVRQARANANRDGFPRWVHGWGQHWWVSMDPVHHSERVDPDPARNTRELVQPTEGGG